MKKFAIVFAAILIWTNHSNAQSFIQAKTNEGRETATQVVNMELYTDMLITPFDAKCEYDVVAYINIEVKPGVVTKKMAENSSAKVNRYEIVSMQEIMDKVVSEAKKLGANGIIGLKIEKNEEHAGDETNTDFADMYVRYVASGYAVNRK